MGLDTGAIEFADDPSEREQLLLNAIVAIANLRDDGHYGVIKYSLLEQLNDMLLKNNYPPMFIKNEKKSSEKTDMVGGGTREGGEDIFP